MRLNKGDWIAAQQCCAQAWYGLRERSTPDEAGLFRMEQGREVGTLARRLYPSGHLVVAADGNTPEEVTAGLLVDDSIQTLFEAAFEEGPFTARADIINRIGAGWHLIEVKSSFSDSSKFDDLVEDIAYTAFVMRRSGVPVSQSSLMVLSRDFRFGDPPERLFQLVDVTGGVEARVNAFEASASATAEALLGDEAPRGALLSACRDCSFFETRCIGAGIEHTVLEIPKLHHTKLKRLSAAGIIDLARAPGDLKLNEVQERAKYSALSGNTVVEAGLGAALDAVVWPCHYLDFETVATVLPLYQGFGCHQQVLTQFSIHHRESPDSEVRHSEFLADAGRECECELAIALIDALGTTGAVVVYSSFEKTRITKLAERFPDLAVPLKAIIDRLVDLLAIVEKNIYHPAFGGSFSIKSVLPALVSELSYEGLGVRNGDMAITRFARMARGEISGDAAEKTRQELLEYCQLDTFAMVRLHEALQASAARRLQAG